MKKLNLIKRLWTDSHEKQSPHRFARYAAMLIMLLTLGVGQMWGWGWTQFESTSPATIYPGDQVTLQILLNGDGNGATYKAIGSGTTNAQANLTWNNSDTYYDYVEKAGDNNRWKFYFTPNSTGTWYWSIWLGWGSSVGDNGRYYNGSTSWNEGNSSYQSSSVTVSAVPKSGSLSAESAGTTSIALSWSKNSLNDDVIIFNGNSKTPSDGSTYNVGSNNVVYKGSGTSATITGLTANTSYTFYIYSIHQTKYYSASNNATAKTDDVATPSISLAMGDGEDELEPGDIVHLTATRNNVDGTPNITYQYSTNNGSTWTNIAAATSSTTMNCTIPENLALSKTYKFRAQMTYSATTYTSSTLSSNVSVQAYYIAGSNGNDSNTDANWLEGKHWSVNGTQLDVQESTSSPVISKTFTGCAAGYHVFKITNGTWSTTYGYSDLTSCNVRYKNGSNNNLEFYLLSAATVKVEFNISTKKIIVTVTHTGNHKTFYVRNTTDWPALYLYNWTVPTNGDWPGQTGADNGGPSHSVRSSITSSQWWAVTIYDGSTGFLLNNGVATDVDGHYQSADQTYSGITDGNWYELASTNGTSMALTSVATSANNTTIIKAPTITTDAASSITATTATLQGDFTINHDKVTDYGFYLLQSNEESRTVEQVIAGTKKQIGTSLNADATDATKAISGLTGHTKYFYVAYATNGFGTSYGTVRSFTTPYKVTITNPAVGGSFSTTGVQYVSSTLDVECTAATGYTFSSWTTNDKCEMSSTTTTDGVTTATLTPTADGATLTAVYTEDMHTVTLNSTYGGGHVELGGETVTSASAGIATGATITAVPALGYYFTGWTGSDINNGVTIASGSTSTASITIRATADSKSITANFARRWVLTGSWLTDGGGDWDYTTNTFYPYAGGYGRAQISNLAANTEYEFKLYDNESGTHWVGYATSGQVYDYDTYRAVSPADSILVNSYPGENITLKTAAKGNYSFYYNFSSHKLYVYFPQSRKISMGTYTKSDGISSVHEGGTISAKDNDENEITDGLYVSNNGSVTFTATPKAGYIWHGWYSSRYCTGDPVATDRTHTVSSITSDVTRYALFEETLYSVKVHRNDAIETTYKVGIDSHPTINAATAPTGKIFDRWVTTGSATVEDPYASTTKITGATDDVSTVTATFKDLPKIYIDMTSATGWNPSKMYVVFYKNGGYFDSNNGTGTNSTYVINALPLEMTKMDVAGKNIWYYAYDPTSGDFEGQTITCVTFIDHTYAANYGNFTEATAVYRTDFSSCMNMFVVTDNTGTNKNTTCYYRNTNAIDGTKGYWRKYEENNSGFYLNNLPGGSVEFTNEDGGNTYSARVNLDANTTYHFYLGCCNGWNWSNDKTTKAFNSDNRTRMVQPYDNVSSDDYRCQLTTTAAGYYTFTITPQNTREVQLSIDFPVAANDYRAVYNNAASSPTVSRPSNIIKNDQNSGTISLWLNKGTNYISFQKATLGAGGAVSWTACGSQQTVTGVAEAGIYTMTLTRDGSIYTVSTPEKYEGDLYIRTDCAPGKWADYTENKLEENAFNFKADDASTFDYYYCKWVNDAGTNVKCVIANEINVALSDTLKGESILVSVGQPSNETLPEGANVRFSYNSVTNTLKRSYLTGSATDVFLNIIPDNEEEVYQTDGTTDMHGDAGAKNKFSDLGNWVYVLNAKVKPGATAAVKANYNSTSQELIAEETTLLGGTEDVLYEIRLIYDFKTNYLMSAWMPSGNVDEAISLNSDIMIVRRGQNDANQLSFSDDGELTDVKRAYGVFEFRKTDMVNHMGSWSDLGYTYGLCMYYFSLPFDVNVSDIFGVGIMGDDWRIQFYNGKKRAEKGWFAGDGTTTFWEDVPADTVLYAYEGYLLMLNRSHFNNGSHKVWNNVTTSTYLYFPSTEPVYALDSIEKPITVPSHECTIDRFFTQDSLEYYDSETKQWKTGARNHKYVDSHWNMMGTPLFRNKAAKSIEACKVKIGEADSTLNYVYEWVPSTNSLSARQVLNTSFTFKPMFAYMVQYAGKVTFEGAAIKPAEIAARRSSEHKQYTVELELTKENQFAGRTYIELRENAVDSFMLNEDMYIMKGSKVADIYTHADGYELAANVLTINSHIVPVSVDTKSAGTYTFSMPSNFSGTVILIDKYANTRVNLAYEDYEVYLEQGAIKDRFEVEININDAPTAIDGAADGEGTLKDGKAHKFIMNDMMYILKDGVLYDARGNRVK